jgi:starch synthase
LIEAGADIFLMPSLYEPCGLNQMYSLRYGTPPVVRRTGGLADTVEAWSPATGEGTGFLFDHATPEGFTWAVEQALAAYRDRPAWRRLMANGMAKDFSWEKQIGRYVELYRRLAA